MRSHLIFEPKFGSQPVSSGHNLNMSLKYTASTQPCAGPAVKQGAFDLFVTTNPLNSLCEYFIHVVSAQAPVMRLFKISVQNESSIRVEKLYEYAFNNGIFEKW